MPDAYTIGQLTLARQIQRAADELLIHRPKLEFTDWAPKHILNPDGTPFQFRPTQVQPAKDLFNPMLTSISIRAFSGAGKTYLFGAGFCYAVEQLRMAAAVMFPNQILAEDWVNEKLEKIFQATPVIQDLEKTRDLKRYKSWTTGAEVYAIGANSSGQIRRLEADLMYTDECDAITQDSADEGDKVAQFEKRGRGRREQFKWRSSYPSLKGASKIDSYYELSDRCRWYVDCLECGHLWEMHTRQMIWTPGQPETARIACPECGTKHDEQARFAMAKEGRYLNKNLEEPEPVGARGFHLGCMAHTGDHDSAYSGYLHEVAAEQERVKKSENPEKARRVFVNTMDAESYAEATEEKPEAHALYQRREPYKPTEMLPAGVLVITMGIDCQKDRLESQVIGFGENREMWCLAYRIFPGSPLSPETWRQVDELRDFEWNHPIAKQPLKIACTFVDSGKWQDSIFQYTFPRTRQRVYACKGAKAIDRPLMDGRPTAVGNRRIPQYHVGTHEAKDLIYQSLALPPPKEGGSFPRGYIHVPKLDEFGPMAGGEGTGYFEGLTAEESRMKRSTQTGEFVRFFENVNRARNEPLDTMVYAIGAERVLRPQYKLIADKMKK